MFKQPGQGSRTGIQQPQRGVHKKIASVDAVAYSDATKAGLKRIHKDADVEKLIKRARTLESRRTVSTTAVSEFTHRDEDIRQDSEQTQEPKPSKDEQKIIYGSASGATKSAEPPRSHLLELPAELRFETYANAMTDFDSTVDKGSRRSTLEPAQPLFHTCKPIRKEAMPLYFACLEDLGAFTRGRSKGAAEDSLALWARGNP